MNGPHRKPNASRAFNILLTSVGRRVMLLRHFKESLAALGLRGRVVAMDIKTNAPGLYEADSFELAPPARSPEYIPRLLEVCERRDISMVVPLIDTELSLLAENRRLFTDRGIELMVSGPQTTSLAADKRRTAAFFTHVGVQTPSILDIDATLADPAALYPLFLKPADGSCSKGAHLLRSRDDLAYFARTVPNAILQDYVDGDEYTLDVLVDPSGTVRCVVPRQRVETRAGEVSKGLTVKDPAIIEAGRRVVEGLPDARGCITVQCFRSHRGDLHFIEINPRFGGGYPLSWAAGARYPQWLIQWQLGQSPEVSLDGWRDRLAMLRYDDAVFVETSTPSPQRG